MPSYRLPHCVGDTISLDELGMVCDLDSATPKHFPDWHCDGDDAHVIGLHTSNHQSHMVASLASCEQLSQDANGFALNFGRDFRALHQFNHDHDCTSTCIKYVAKKCKEAAESAIKKVPLLHVDFFFYVIIPFTYVCSTTNELITKRIRRKGKELVPEPYIAITNDHGEFGKAILTRDTPFRSSTSDIAQVWGRCNTDFQFMARTLDPNPIR